jgi:hypothetical protein
MLENVSDAESSREAFDPAFEELQVRGVSEAYGIQTIGFSAGHVTRSRTALGVCILVMAYQRLPVSITGSLD